MNFENTEVFNFEGAIRGMRNPLNSWNKSDSEYKVVHIDQFSLEETKDFIVGPNDLDLAQRLISGGPEHAKFLRQIFVSVDITAPLYWWKEADTYKIGTTANSTSTMHRLMAEPFEYKDFELDENRWLPIFEEDTYSNSSYQEYIDSIIKMCNHLRNNYLTTEDKRYWRALVQILPNAYLQTRTWTANYAVLRNIYFQRKNHKLREWYQFRDWIKSLPYSKELITLGDNNES